MDIKYIPHKITFTTDNTTVKLSNIHLQNVYQIWTPQTKHIQPNWLPSIKMKDFPVNRIPANIKFW